MPPPGLRALPWVLEQERRDRAACRRAAENALIDDCGQWDLEHSAIATDRCSVWDTYNNTETHDLRRTTLSMGQLDPHGCDWAANINHAYRLASVWRAQYPKRR